MDIVLTIKCTIRNPSAWLIEVWLTFSANSTSAEAWNSYSARALTMDIMTFKASLSIWLFLFEKGYAKVQLKNNQSP